MDRGWYQETARSRDGWHGESRQDATGTLWNGGQFGDPDNRQQLSGINWNTQDEDVIMEDVEPLENYHNEWEVVNPVTEIEMGIPEEPNEPDQTEPIEECTIIGECIVIEDDSSVATEESFTSALSDVEEEPAAAMEEEMGESPPYLNPRYVEQDEQDGPGTITTSTDETGPASGVAPAEEDPVAMAESTAEDEGKKDIPLPADYDNLSQKLQALERAMRSTKGDCETFMWTVVTGIAERFKRMPRRGWKRAAVFWKEKYNLDGSIEYLIKRAKQLVHKKKVQRTLEVQEIVPLKEDKLQKDIIEHFCKLVNKRLEGPFIIRDMRNRRYTESTIDIQGVTALNIALEYYKRLREIKGMGMIAIVLQTAQDCYDDIVYKPPPRTGWRENIKNKIANADRMLHLLDCYRREVELDKDVVKEIRAYMKHFNKIADKPQDLEEVRQLTIEAKKREELKLQAQDYKRRFTNCNRMFELYPGRFFRQLEETSEVDESAITADMQKEFWSQMWVTPQTELRYQDYITERPPPISEAGFPSIDEFKETIKMLGNWKSPGPDGVYNYYIKYMIAIHEELYDAVKNMCLGKQVEDGWFYEGTTYLFSKKAKPTSAVH